MLQMHWQFLYWCVSACNMLCIDVCLIHESALMPASDTAKCTCSDTVSNVYARADQRYSALWLFARRFQVMLQDRTGQDKTRQDKTRQDKTRQGKATQRNATQRNATQHNTPWSNCTLTKLHTDVDRFEVLPACHPQSVITVPIKLSIPPHCSSIQ